MLLKEMPFGLMLDRRTWLAFFGEIESPTGDVSWEVESQGCVPNMEGAVVIPVISERLDLGCNQGERSEAVMIVASDGPLGRED